MEHEKYSRNSRITRSRNECEKQKEANVEDAEVFIIKEIIRNPPPEINWPSYFCKTCDIEMNSKKVYETHIMGRKHNIKLNFQKPRIEQGSPEKKENIRHFQIYPQ